MAFLFIFFTFLFGLTIGSFLNCLIWRIHKEEKATGRSYCPKCRQQIRWYDNIPILSFVLLKGKCRDCGERISWQYPVVELMTAVLFAASFLNLFNINATSPLTPLPEGDFFTLIFYWFIISVMIMVFVFDFRWYIIPDIITLPAIAVSIILQMIINIHVWQNLVISGIIGLGFFLFQFVISKGKWIGGGDLRLGLLMGVALGWPKIIAAIVLSYFLGSIVAVYLLATGKKKMGGKLPLGTFLAIGTILILLWGEEIIKIYLDFILL